jgi:hypothetical protein
MFFSSLAKLVQRGHRIEKMAAISGVLHEAMVKRLAKSMPATKNACQSGSSVV